MKNENLFNLRKIVLLGIILSFTTGCERDLTDDVQLAGFPTNGDVFLDTFTGGLDYFPFDGSYFDAFSVDTETKYDGSASMRFDVPNVGDPLGAYSGAIFRLDSGRDLSGYDALTFWAKGTRSGKINEIGLGQDFEENKYLVTTDIQLTTNWRKYIIPLPDASKLTQERGLFWYAEGAENNEGYSFWIDELKYEKLGTIAQPRPSIFGGEDIIADTFSGITIPITELQQTFNLGSGIDKTVTVAPAYFAFSSSNPSVATVDEFGAVTVKSSGIAVITANLGGVLNSTTNEIEGGVDAEGSLTVNSLGVFELAPTPELAPNDVISIFSDHYENVPVDFYNGYWEPFQTTLSADFVVSGDNILNYTNFNFVGNQFANPTVDATEKSNLHIDMYIPGDIPSNLDFLISIVNFGPDQVDGGGDDTRQQVFFNSSDFEADKWSSLDIPITLASRNNIGLIIYENINGSPLSNFYLDNIYFYGEEEITSGPTTAAPTPTAAASDVISIYSDVYTDIGNDGLNNFDSGSILEQEMVGSDNILKYSNLNFTGLEFIGENIIDASGASTLHIDIWSPDANEFKIKLVDFGADGAFDGGDDTEFEINFGPTAVNEWVSLDIPLSSFTGLASTEHIAQIILVNAPSGTLYIDNLYFTN